MLFKKVIKIAPMALGAALFVSCAKEKPYEENTARILNQMSGSEYAKSQLDICSLEDPCLWVPSVANTPYNVSASRPYWQGEEKLVVTQITENKLKILQIEEDERFSDNINNFSPVAEFEIAHVDYKCQEDSLGECANKEVEDNEKPWEQKRFMRLKSFNVVEKNSLPIQFEQLFNAGCFTKTGGEDLKNKFAKVENGAINVGVKTAYEASAKCVMLREMEDLRYLNFTVDYHYSMVKLSEVADKDYRPIQYPSTDEAHYGFFKTTKKSKTVDNHDHYMGLRTNLMNRWSPNKKEVVYHLNEDFYRPGMENILKATTAAMEAVNFSLEQANAKFKIKLADGRGKDIGDIRNNFLVLESDPQASGVIGYGPSVVNPRTGEIVNARTVMYYGTIKKFIARTYDELVEETLNGGGDDQASAPANAAAATQTDSALVGERASAVIPYFAQKVRKAQFSTLLDIEGVWRTQIDELLHLNQKPVDLKDTVKISEDLKRFKEKIDMMSEQTFFHGSLLNFEDAVKEFIKDQDGKMWDELTEKQRASIIDKLLPSVWVPTLVHEFGHNLGLRHNFYGSTDEENYYTKVERQALGMKRDVTYSSIMDYSYSTLNELSVMGKYDIAALRFAYAREAETKDGEALKVETTLASLVENDQKAAQNIKKYAYCSDEHVGNDPLCNRFDEGKNHQEVVQHYIDTYKENYSKRYFRNRRYDFSGRYGDWNHAISLFNTLSGIRQFFDQYDQRVFRGDYDKQDVSEERQKELADIKKASDLAFNALMDIVETPAYHCLEIYIKGGQIAGVGQARPFNEMAKGTKLEDYGITFDIAHGCEFLASFEARDPTPGLPAGVQKSYLSFGKYFNNSLDLTVPYDQKVQGDTSQIDVRGYWMDKVVASIFLSSRSQSPTTIGAASNGSFLDYPEYKKRFVKFIEGFMTNKFEKEVELKMGEQTIGKMPMTYSFDGNHLVNKSYNYIVNGVFGLDQTQNDLKSVMMKFLKENFKTPQSKVDLERDIKLYHDYNAARLNPRVDADDYNYDKKVEFKNKAGEVVYLFGLYDYNTFGMELVKKKEALEEIEALPEASAKVLVETMQALSKAQSQDEVMAILSAVGDEKVLALIGENQEEVVDYLNGTLTMKGLLTSFLALTE